MSEIQSLIENYEKLCKKYGNKKAFKSLKKHYCDVCSNGDAIINKLIDILKEDECHEKMETFVNNSENKDFILNLIQNYLMNTIQDFISGNELQPNPFWAD